MEKTFSKKKVIIESSDSTKEKHTGLMIALWPPNNVAKELSKYATENLEDLHLTLIYIKEYNLSDKEKIKNIVKEFSKNNAIGGKIGGIGRFSASGDNDKDVIWASVDSPQLTDFRQNLIKKLKDSGINFEENHGYTPHITLKYISPKEKYKLEHFKPIDIKFSDIIVAIGDNKTKFSLKDDAINENFAVLRESWKKHFKIKISETNKKCDSINKKKHKGFGTYFDYGLFDAPKENDEDGGEGGIDEEIDATDQVAPKNVKEWDVK